MKRNMKHAMLAVAEAVAVLALVGCGGADVDPAVEGDALEEAERRRWRSIDSIAPAVVIDTAPSTSATGSANLAGSASDNRRLARVRWSNSLGGEGLAVMEGTTTQTRWSATGIPLRAGTNTITVTAVDAAGNRSSKSIAISSDAPVPAPVPPAPVPPAPVPPAPVPPAPVPPAPVPPAPVPPAPVPPAPVPPAPVPPAPIPPAPAPAPTGAAILTWTAVPSPIVTGYRVYYGTAPGSYVQARGTGLATGNTSTFTAAGLQQGVAYYFAVTSTDAAGNESGFSAEASKLIQ